MIGEGEPLQTDSPSKFEQAKEAVQTATEDVKTTSRAIRDVIDRRPGAPLDRLAEWTREAPLHALLVAFLFGMVVGPRR
jgi:hypothetical protein